MTELNTLAPPGETHPLVRPLEDVDLLAVHRTHPQRYPFLLESAAAQPNLARYDILFATSGRALVLNRAGRLSGPAGADGDFLTALDRWFGRAGGIVAGPVENARAPRLPFTGGWFLLLGYELAAQIEPRLDLPPPAFDFPVALAVRCRAGIVRDRRRRRCYLVAEAGAGDRLEQMSRDAREARRGGATGAGGTLAGAVSEEPPARFLAGVERVHEYILAGDVFQVNLSRQWRVRCDGSPSALYAALKGHNPAPFAGLALWDDRAVISSSPERLVEVRGGWAQTRPIAGTRPRLDRRHDRERIAELIAHPKERAEHIMLIDMERNDLGRVCLPGSVRVDELMTVESYAHVHHIVSNVRGRLSRDATPGQVIRAVFPGGTITGCPKVRCMEIIAEIEREGRGPYTGAMGYLNLDGSLDLNILIRTMVATPGEVLLRAGAGIVADSVPEAELEETRSKALGLLRAFRADG